MALRTVPDRGRARVGPCDVVRHAAELQAEWHLLRLDSRHNRDVAGPMDDPDSDDARDMLADAMRDLVIDRLAELDFEHLTDDELKNLVAIFRQVKERLAEEGKSPAAYEGSLAWEIEVRRRKRGLGPVGPGVPE